MNDPFELMAAVQTEEGFRRAFSAVKKQFHDENGAICFSLNATNPVLWSHYANKHRGVALGFEITENPQHNIKINYSENRIIPKLDHNNPNRLDYNNMMNILTTKYTHWSYEQEIRLHIKLDHETEQNGLFFFDFNHDIELKEVILGYSCEAELEAVHDLVKNKYPNVSIKRAALSFDKFEIIF